MKKKNLLGIGLILGLIFILIETVPAIVLLDYSEWDWLRRWAIPGTTGACIFLYFKIILEGLK